MVVRCGRSPLSVRKSAIQSGTLPKMRAERPLATCRSATKSTAFAPGRSAPTSTHEASSPLVARSTRLPRRHAVNANMSAAAARKRTPTAKSGGIVSPVNSMPRYVEPQITYTVARATQTFAPWLIPAPGAGKAGASALW